jgi:hypothetical protein
MERGMAVVSNRKTTGVTDNNRVALCVGVSKYPSAPLKNSANDAKDVSDALRSLGFDTMLLLEPKTRQLLDGVESFAAKLRPGGMGVFFFAGACRQRVSNCCVAPRPGWSAPPPCSLLHD